MRVVIVSAYQMLCRTQTKSHHKTAATLRKQCAACEGEPNHGHGAGMAKAVRRKQISRVVRCLFGAVGLILASPGFAKAQSAAAVNGVYGSLKADRVDVRAAPGMDQPVAFIFRRAGMPVMLLESAKGWQRVRDSEGATGWVLADLVSRRRTALVLPAAKSDGQVAIRSTESAGSAPLAYLEPGVVVGIVSCERENCWISTSNLRGVVDRRQLWGVGEGEIRP